MLSSRHDHDLPVNECLWRWNLNMKFSDHNAASRESGWMYLRLMYSGLLRLVIDIVARVQASTVYSLFTFIYLVHCPENWQSIEQHWIMIQLSILLFRLFLWTFEEGEFERKLQGKHENQIRNEISMKKLWKALFPMINLHKIIFDASLKLSRERNL